MKVWSQSSVGQQAVEFLVRCCEIQAWSCLEGFSVDCIWVVMVSGKDILIALAWNDWEPSCLIYINFPGKINCLEKDKIAFSLLCGLKGTDDALDLVLYAWLCLVWIWGPFAFAGGAQVWLIFFVRCLWTRSNDRPVQEVKKSLVIAFTHPEWVGIQQDAWW